MAILVVVQILFAASAVLTKNIHSGYELKYIGSLKSSSVQGRSGQVVDETKYFMSPNAASWNSAAADCSNQLGPNGTLLAIESEEEWKYLEIILENYGFATTYWTSGLYDPSSTIWRWTVNDHPLPPFAPWDNRYPSTTANALLRVLLYYTNRFNANWRTVSSTQLHRYICEVQVPTLAVPCYETNDLAIVLDSSQSIGYDDFEKAKVFVERLASAFTVHSESRLSFITYSNNANIRIDITNTYSRAEISSTILSTPWEAGSTYTNLGMLSAMSQLTNYSQQAPMNMVILTDGESTIPDFTTQVANVAINMGIRLFSVGITEYINNEELLTIAGNDASRVFSTENFDELVNLLTPLSVKICHR